jgi:hypothetical protein
MRGGTITLVAVLMVSLTTWGSLSTAHGEGAPQCHAIKRYLDQVEQVSTFSFGSDREKSLSDARSALDGQLAKLSYPISEELSDLLKRYASLTSFGHDRMRKGDAGMLVKAREVQEKIKALCPW